MSDTSLTALIATVSHPVRSAIVESVTIEPASAAELAEQLGVPVETVRGHLRTLLRAGLVKRAEKTRRRGVHEFLYRATGPHRVILGRGFSGRVSSRRADEATLRSLRLTLREARAALRVGTFARHKESGLVRFPFPVDEQGLHEAHEIHMRLISQIVTAAGSGKARQEAGSGRGILAEAATLFYEMPSPWPIPLSPDANRREQWERVSNRSLVDMVASLTQGSRLKVLDFLTLKPATAGEISDALNLSKKAVRYELKQLRRIGFVEVHSERTRRGARERVYIADNRKCIFYSDDMATYEGSRLASAHEVGVSWIFTDAVNAMRAGVFRERDDSLLMRVLTRLDPRALAEIEARQADALHKLLDLRETCLRRIEETEGETRVAYSGLLLFERAPHSLLRSRPVKY